MVLNLNSIFSDIDSVLNDLLSKYTGLRFIGFDQLLDNKRVYLTPLIKSGFYYKQKKLPITGENVERLRIATEDSTINSVLNINGVMAELSDDSGNFTRFTIKVLKEPTPPTFEWYLSLIPNKQDKSLIT